MQNEQRTMDKNGSPMHEQRYYTDERGPHHGGTGRFVLGLFVILIGLLYLFRTLGWADISLKINIARLWPLFIILIGLWLIPRRSGFLSVAMKFLVAISTVVILVLAVLTGNISRHDDREAPNRLIAVARDPNVSEAHLAIKTGAGRLALGAGGELLVSGEFESRGSDLQISDNVYGMRQEVELRGDSLWRDFGMRPHVLNLKVNPEIPLALEVDAGASKMDLDLSDVLLRSLDIDTGASDLDLVLGDKSPYADININAGASSVKILLPQGSGVRMRLDSGVSAKHIEGLRESSPGVYVSENYEGAYSKIDLNIAIGISNLDVRWRE